MSFISVDNLRYRYPNQIDLALDHVSFEIEKGEFIGIIGKNGSGKSSLCQSLNGLIPHFHKGAYGGQVIIDGKSVKETPISEMATICGMVFQNPFTQMTGSKLTVYEEVAFGLENLGIPRSEMIKRVEEALLLMDIPDLKHQSPFELSGGQMQRVAIASVMAMRPKLMIFDEPTSQLDPKGTEDVFKTIRKLSDEGITVIIVEHKIEKLAEYADRLLLMSDGKVIDFDQPKSLFTRINLKSHHVNPPIFINIIKQLGMDLSANGMPVTLDEAAAILKSKGETAAYPMVDHHEKITPASRISIQNVSFSYDKGKNVLQDINLEIGNQATAIIGQNGAGKSTLMKLLKGLIKPTQGTCFIDGINTKHSTAAKLSSKIGMVFQNPDDQIFKNTVFDEVAFGPRNHYGETTAKKLTNEALRRVGMIEKRDVNPYDLSFADRKLISIASILGMNPDIIIFDEPTLGQDSLGIATLKKIIESLISEKKTVLAILHDMDFAAEMFDRMVVMANGQVIKDGPAHAVFSTDDVLRKAHLEPPHISQLARRCGMSQPILNVDEFLRSYHPLDILKDC
jgi:energy-coupling factor transport system ATP-binding protein